MNLLWSRTANEFKTITILWMLDKSGEGIKCILSGLQ